jgi:polyisoprenoid-binding protein YceI
MAVLSLAACTAIKVITHDSNSDPQASPAGHYQLDPHHWNLSFDVDHLGFSRFVMRFDRARIDVDFVAQDPERSSVVMVIEAASFDSNVAELDSLVTGKSLLDASAYPDIRFVSRKLHRTSPGGGEITGDLTIRDVTHPVTLAVTFNGGGANPLTGEETMGFSAQGSIDRSDFGLIRWFPAVGNRIGLRFEGELVKPAG